VIYFIYLFNSKQKKTVRNDRRAPEGTSKLYYYEIYYKCQFPYLKY